MLQKEFDLSEHYFLCRVQSTGQDGFTTICNNIVNFNNLGKSKIQKFFALRSMLTKSSNIVIHGFIFNNLWLIFLYFNKYLLKKAIWIVWGIDLYNFLNPTKSSVKNRIMNHIMYSCRKACKTAIVVFPSDISIYKKYFKNTPTMFMIPLMLSDSNFIDWDMLNSSSQKHIAEQTTKQTIEIMIGHNAFQFNRHCEILRMLERFKNENIHITIPLSYDSDLTNETSVYIEEIKRLIRDLSMDNKVSILTKLIPKTEYHMLIAKMDIAIFNAPRQCGLGNIAALLYLGKKVFLPSDNPMLDVFNRIQGIEIHNVKEIMSETFNEFIRPINVPYPHPFIKYFFSIENAAPRWKIIFDYNKGCYPAEEALSRLNSLMNEQKSTAGIHIAHIDKNTYQC